MNEAPPSDITVEVFQQLGSISAVLGGLAFAAAAAFLAVSAGGGSRRPLSLPASLTAGAAVASAACLIIAALTWSLLAARTAAVVAMGRELSAEVLALNQPASLVFIVGVALFFGSLGASGWVASRVLGVVTTLIGVLAGVASVVIIFRFVD